jgi:5-methyltetrahydrofolate--homocysteine methyltransferase
MRSKGSGDIPSLEGVGMTGREELLDQLYGFVLSGDVDQAVAATQEGLRGDIEPTALLFDAMIPALEEVGRRFETGEVFLPEMLIAANAMQGAMTIIRPLIVAAGVETIGRFVMGTVAGDIHDVGKKLCNVMLEGAGFEVIDLGINVAGQRFVDAIRDFQPGVVGMSAFLTTTALEFARNIELIEEAGLRDQVKILIGGAPVDQAMVDSVGADGFAPDASSAVRLTKTVLGIS